MVEIIKKLTFVFNVTILARIIWRNRTLLWQLTKRNIVARYRGSMLGVFWGLVQPLMMLCIYTFVFSVVFEARWGVNIEKFKGAFAIIMFCGMALYSIFAECVSCSCGLIIGNPNFVKKVIFPLEILPLAQCISSLILGLEWFVLLFLGVIFIYGDLNYTMLLLPIILIPLFLFSLGISYFVASLSVYVRDTAYIVQVILQMLFFMTPIVYPIMAVPEKYRWLLETNPLTVLIEQCRKIFLYGIMPDWLFLGNAALVSLIILHLGFIWFFKTKKGFSDVL